MKVKTVFALAVILAVMLLQAPQAQANFIDDMGYRINVILQVPLINLTCRQLLPMVITDNPDSYVQKCIAGGKHEIKKNWGKAAATSTLVE